MRLLSNFSGKGSRMARGGARQRVEQGLLLAWRGRIWPQFVDLALVLFGCLGLTALAPAEITVNIQISEHIPRDGQCSFTVTLTGSPSVRGSDLKQSMKLEMPGFSGIRISETGTDKLQVTATISQPGFYPFRVIFSAQGRDYTAADYFVVESNSQPRTFNHIGYYVFLGRGDFWDPTHQLALWTLQNWKSFAEWMSKHHADTLYLLLNGYTLAYPSEKYPGLRDSFSNNARYGFLREFIEYAHQQGIHVYLVLTTDDHAEGFGNLHPETVRINQFGYAAARRALALEEPKVRQYIEDVFQEVLTLYGNADGFVFHPSEEDPDRFNASSRAAYYQETGKDLAIASKSDRYRWYNQKFAELLSSLYSKGSATNPNLEFVMFNTWWQDEYVSLYERTLPAKFKICIWFYDEQEEKTFRKWPIWPWVEAFGADRITYMPSGEAFLYPQDRLKQLERHIRLDRLVSAADALHVQTCVFFAGWDLGSDFDRRRDLAIAWFPTISRVRDRTRMQELLPELYTDYFGTRATVFK